jgi:hypothetical protein
VAAPPPPLTFNKYFCNEIAGRLDVNIAKTYYLHKRDKVNLKEILDSTGLPALLSPTATVQASE